MRRAQRRRSKRHAKDTGATRALPRMRAAASSGHRSTSIDKHTKELPMRLTFEQKRIALAAAAAVGVVTLGTGSPPASAQGTSPRGTYLAGDFHNHSTCSDGAVSMQKKVRKSMDRTEA